VPDLKVTAEDGFVSENGSGMVGRYRYAGTHAANFLGYPATGRPFVMHSIDIWRVEDKHVVAHWGERNILDVFIQIGAVPRGISPADSARAAAARYRGSTAPTAAARRSWVLAQVASRPDRSTSRSAFTTSRRSNPR
jgi:hypothetical protein